ncbi:MAG: alkaline phosphatase family protein [Syntrophorhabdaceae bacterium]|nr:alkaline phosphatase family protein [Syntrophorhabdaceae bacterium]
MEKQRIVVALIDGLGLDYFSYMAKLNKMAINGFYKTVNAVMPTVTNVNNVSVCCGAWPIEHGISGNSYYDAHSNLAVYMNSVDLIRYPTLFYRASKTGLKTALLTAKKKTVELFLNHPYIAIAAEEPPEEYIKRYGKPPSIYSTEINYWLWEVLIDILKTDEEIKVIYIHTTDYPMHQWAADEQKSIQHLSKLDTLIGEAKDVAPDVAFFITADHGMNRKKRCWDLMKACMNRGLTLRFALSPERDYYTLHHRNFAGSCWVWLNNYQDEKRFLEITSSLEGIEEVIPKEEIVKRYKLPNQYIGDFMILGDKDTVFGEMENEFEILPDHYRAHGSLYESKVPLIIYGYDYKIPEEDYFTHNLHLTRFLF